MSFKVNSTIANCGGQLLKLGHASSLLGCNMDVNLFLPPQADVKQVPVLFYLSGLTCTPQNCTEKGFFQYWASQHGIAIVYPDTSPRGLGIAGEDESWDFGTGAGFYLNATKEPYSKNYKMYSYITEELPELLFTTYASKLDKTKVSITGHSMGGHGALTLFLKNPGKYKSVSAFSPICNPSKCPWGIKAFTGYFGDSSEIIESAWKTHDATELIKSYKGSQKIDILIDVGTGDPFYKDKQLLPENLVQAAIDAGLGPKAVNVRYQPDYDHSYFFISSFAKDHVDHAAKYLGLTSNL